MSYITTNSKIHFTPHNPNRDHIDINDIAHALAYICRANGHFNSFYSVAQHSINCSLEAREKGYPKDIQLACLLHDASEAYMSDVTRPVKKLLPQYLDIEERLQRAIYEKFNVSDVCAEMIKEIDDTLLYHEFIHLLGEKVFDFEPEILSVPDFTQRDFIYVKNQFLNLFVQLTLDIQIFKSVGIDGCDGGWMTAILSGDRLSIERYNSIADVLAANKSADKSIIDIPIGLADSKEVALHRPENVARKILKGKTSSVFPVPFRSVARAKTVAEAWNLSKTLNVGANYMTMGIREAVNEIDIFLQENEEWKNVLIESHPEVCFALLNGGKPIVEKKQEEQGIERRLQILEKYGIGIKTISIHPLFAKYRDDVVDAVCLALIGRLATEGKTTTIPCEGEVMADSTGLRMQMIIPKI
jgi:predicted RNase H-like nuclease